MNNQKFEALVNGMLTASKNKQANLWNDKNVKELRQLFQDFGKIYSNNK